MVISNGYLMIFALAMMGCVLATPLVTQIATWVGAIDRPDQFRRIHEGAIPRLGGLGLALGIAAGTILPHFSGSSRLISLSLSDLHHEWVILIAALIILVVGFVDDTRSLGPRVKLLGQALAVLILYLGGIRIQTIDVLGANLDLSSPSLEFSLLGMPMNLALPSLAVTMLWFLGCMNVWNLIDGMDGLASGVGLLVSGTLTLVAIHNENTEVAILAVALAGSLAGFLLYNWHPACIFLGDSGALLIGLLIGVIGVQGSMKGPSAISILFPILAMGLPISDTAMAIFRRWVRNLPLSAADRRHVHHLLIGLGLNPRQAALMLYCFSGFLCGAVLAGRGAAERIPGADPGDLGLPRVPGGGDQPPRRAVEPARRLAGPDGAGPAGAARGQADLGGHPADRAVRLVADGLRDRRADGRGCWAAT